MIYAAANPSLILRNGQSAMGLLMQSKRAVDRRASLQDADRDDRRLVGSHLSGNHSLKPHDSRCSHDNRINGGLRHRPVRATAEQPDLKAVCRRGDGPALPAISPAAPSMTC